MSEQENTHYETIGRILSEAGFFLLARNENVRVEKGIISTAYGNIISKKTDVDQDVNKDDVSVYISGDEFVVKEIDAENGRITLEDTEQTTQNAKVTYHYSPVMVSFAEVTREDVENRIRKKLSGMSGCECMKKADFKESLRMITRLWAAGLLQTKDYGYNVDSEETSKDGYRKINEAKSLLNELYDECAANCGQDDVNGGAAEVIGGDGGNLFGDFDHRRPRGDF